MDFFTFLLVSELLMQIHCNLLFLRVGEMGTMGLAVAEQSTHSHISPTCIRTEGYETFHTSVRDFKSTRDF